MPQNTSPKPGAQSQAQTLIGLDSDVHGPDAFASSRPARFHAGGSAQHIAHSPTSAKPLTRIERALLQALRTGASNKVLALQLGKSSHTVRNQLSALFAKIGVGNRTQALGWLQAQTQTARLLANGGDPVSSDRGFGTSVLLPSAAAPGTMAQHAAATPSAFAGSFRGASGAGV